MKHLVVAVAIVAASCSKKADNAGPAAGSSAAAAAGKPAAAAGATKWLAIDPFHVELQVPSCAELSMVDEKSALIVDQGADCPQMNVGVTNEDQAESFDDHVKGIQDAGSIKRKVVRKEQTADGWIVESTNQNAGDNSPSQVVEVQLGKIQCRADSFNPAEAAAQRAACESMRKK